LLLPAAGQQAAQPSPPGQVTSDHAPIAQVVERLARILKIKYVIDPRVKGEVTLTSNPDAPGADARKLLDSALLSGNARMIQDGALYRIVPIEISLGADMGAGFRACVPGENSPAGTVFNGYRKVVAQGLMGQSCHWELEKR
jgi:general secretion pathway protein D